MKASPPHPAGADARWEPGLLVAGLAMIALLAAYWPALHGEFIWDDDAWTTKLEPVFRSPSGFWQLWLNPASLQQYYPLTATTFWLDWHLWGSWTLPYHVENVALHGLSAFLLGKLLCRLRIPGAWLAAAVFAFHPVMVESVAWITERKNVLSLALTLGSALAYGRFAHWWREIERPRSGRAYALALVLCLAALLAKVTAFVLAPTLLLFCWWKRGSLRWRQDVFPTAPFFVITLGIGVVVWWLETHQVGAEGREFAAPLAERIVSSGRACWFYLWKLLWPADLCFIYPDWRTEPARWWHWLWPSSVAIAVAILWLLRERFGRGLLAAVLFYLGALFPVMGLLNVYGALFSPVWDHWAYVPALGVIVPACAALTGLLGKISRQTLALGLPSALVAILGFLSWRLCRQYASNEALWTETIRRNPAAWLALNNHGAALARSGRFEEGVALIHRAIAARPIYPKAYNNLGTAFLHQGRLQEAARAYQQAIEQDRQFAAFPRMNLGGVFLMQGRPAQALEQLYASVALQPDFLDGLLALGTVLVQTGQPGAAVEPLWRAVRLRPDFAPGWAQLGSANESLGRVGEAIACYRRALQIDPAMVEIQRRVDTAIAANPALASIPAKTPSGPPPAEPSPTAARHREMGLSLIQQGLLGQGAAQFIAALDRNPADAETAADLAQVLLQQGRAAEAIPILDRALVQQPQHGTARHRRAVAAAQLGQYGDAIHHYGEALKTGDAKIGTLNNLAHILATAPESRFRDGSRAVELARQALRQAGGRHAVLERTLAAALAETGDFAQASEVAGKAREWAQAAGDTALAESIRGDLELYGRSQPVRESKAEAPPG